MKLLYMIRSHKCPICGSADIYRSKRKGFAEKLACRITPVRPFRCKSCNSRVYAFETDTRKSA